MMCDRVIKDLQWHAQGYTFTSTVGILPLRCFDMILGEDWLESCSPMWVHWSKKLMKFTYNGQRVSLQGLTVDRVKCSAIQEQKMKGVLNRKTCSHVIQLHCHLLHGEVNQVKGEGQLAKLQLHPMIEGLVREYSEVFQTPSALPPTRIFDHKIQLVPGAQPVNLRPYRYSPVQKTEIENQLKEMLKNGIIKHSESPYASLVLLVKKKDGS